MKEWQGERGALVRMTRPPLGSAGDLKQMSLRSTVRLRTSARCLA